MRIVNSLLCVAVLLLSGCGGGFGAAKSGEAGETMGPHPITDGYHHSLPKTGERVIVWGGHPVANGTVINWLQRQGLRIVERAQLQKIFDEQHIRLTHSTDDEAQILRVGHLLGADEVAFLDTPITGGSRTVGGSFAYGGAGSSTLDSSSVYSTSAWIRGVSIETGEILWSATARYSEPFANLDDTLARLTCHALATAWGYRPPGQPDTLADMCLAKSSPHY